ncbi:MAG: nucleotide-diphospho-sugar transferase [Sphingobacteriia bacterium]
MSLETPGLLITFNRADTVAQVLAALRLHRPTRLYWAGDAARPHKPGEAERVAETRALVQQVDWPCAIKTLFHDQNLGCRQGVSAAISWFFAHEEAGIILEDDTVPGPDMPAYCTQLLERYWHHPQVYHIGTNQYNPHMRHHPYSYFASQIPHVWGWATWRHKWAAYQEAEALLTATDRVPELRPEQAPPYLGAFFSQKLEAVRRGEIDAWSYLWAYAILQRGGIALAPRVNLTTNIGMGIQVAGANFSGVSARATFGFFPTYPLLPLQHPPSLAVNQRADHWTYRQVLHWGLWRKIKSKLWTTWERLVLRIC